MCSIFIFISSVRMRTVLWYIFFVQGLMQVQVVQVHNSKFSELHGLLITVMFRHISGFTTMLIELKLCGLTTDNRIDF